MYIAIETATRTSGVAVVDGDRFTEINRDARLVHSEILLPQLEEVLRQSEAPRGEIEAVAVSIGPGSFTGLRIGLATAKSLAYAWSVPIVGVPTLEALAMNFPFSTVLTMLDAQRNRAYYQMFKCLRAADGVKVGSLDEIMMSASTVEGKVIICGDVADRIRNMPSNVELAPVNLRMPRAVNVGLCGRARFESGLADNVMNLEPVYVRRSEAEELWEKRHSNSA